MTKATRDIQTLDASGQAPGRLATRIAMILMGKHKASYTANTDMGDAVEVKNASKMVVTGKKVEQKLYHHHTMFPSGLRTTSLKAILATDPSDVLRRAVSRMLPKNKLRTERMKRLNITN